MSPIIQAGNVLPLRPLSEEEKRVFAEQVQQRMVTRVFEKAEAGVPEAVLKVLRLELEGGLCPRCKKPWKQVPIDNRFYKGFYWAPDCWCFTRCPKCEESLHELEAAGAMGKQCPNCGYELFRMEEHVDEKGVVTQVKTYRTSRGYHEIEARKRDATAERFEKNRRGFKKIQENRRGRIGTGLDDGDRGAEDRRGIPKGQPGEAHRSEDPGPIF